MSAGGGIWSSRRGTGANGCFRQICQKEEARELREMVDLRDLRLVLSLFHALSTVTVQICSIPTCELVVDNVCHALITWACFSQSADGKWCLPAPDNESKLS